MILSLTKRLGQIGPSINTRTEKHGEEGVPGIDIPVLEIFLSAEEFCQIMQDTEAHERMYIEKPGGAIEPCWPTLPPIELPDQYIGARVTIEPIEGAGETLVMKPAKVSKIKLERQVGGLTRMKCTVQGNPPDHTDVLALLNKKCRVSIINASLDEPKADNQNNLPLDDKPQGEVTMGEAALDAEVFRAARDADEAISEMGRRVMYSAAKKAKKARKRK